MRKSQYTLQEKRDFAAQMRRNMTRAEQTLWWKLSKNHFGYRFQRQFPLRGYIVDFYCAQLRLIIEIDGSIHDIEDVAVDDEQRERILENYGFLVLRFSNEDVLDHTTVVLTRLWEECAARRAALKAFPSWKELKKLHKKPAVLSSSCGSVEKQSHPATVDKKTVERVPATAEDYQRINEMWRRLVAVSGARSTIMTGAELTTSAERALEQKYGALEVIKKRSESAALAIKGMHITDPGRRQA